MSNSRRISSFQETEKPAPQPVQNNQQPRSKPTLFQSIIFGSVAGTVETIIDHPLWVIKTRMQSGGIFTLNPRILYRGIIPNAASMMPITAAQVGMNQALQDMFFKDKTELSNIEQVECAFAAGVGSAVISCPTEMVMTQQGKIHPGFYSTGQYLLKQRGFSSLFTGITATAVRDGGFTAFFLGIRPIFKPYIRAYFHDEKAVSLLAGMGAGIGATVLTQAADTTKTVQQAASISAPAKLNQAIKNHYSAHGAAGFFKGIVARGGRVMSAVTIMGEVTDRLEAKYCRKP